MNNEFYRAFEDRFRGASDLIKDRLRVYIPFVATLLDLDGVNFKALDLGCGRGEWLELLREQGAVAKGVDLDDGMLSKCYENSLDVEKDDLIEYLKSSDADSISLITAFHVVEHLGFEGLKTLVCESMRVLRPGGILIMETPNPENIVVGASSFYLDPTHHRPLPPDLLAFIPRYVGFKNIKVLRLQEDSNIATEDFPINLLTVLQGVSPDYAVLAQKNASTAYLGRFESLFVRDYGLSLSAVVEIYEGALRKDKVHIFNALNDLKMNVDELNRRMGIIWLVLGPLRRIVRFFKGVNK